MKEKNESSAFIYMNWVKSRLNNSFINLRLQMFTHMTEIIKTELLKFVKNVENRKWYCYFCD